MTSEAWAADPERFVQATGIWSAKKPTNTTVISAIADEIQLRLIREGIED